MSNLINSIDQVILENDLPFEWSDKINKELKDISPNKTLKRIDLRKKYFEQVEDSQMIAKPVLKIESEKE